MKNEKVADKKSNQKIRFVKKANCSNNYSISPDVTAELIETKGDISLIICGEVEVTCPTDSFVILD